MDRSYPISGDIYSGICLICYGLLRDPRSGSLCVLGGFGDTKKTESLSQAFTGRYFSLDFKFGNFSYLSDSLNSISAYCWEHLHPVGF